MATLERIHWLQLIWSVKTYIFSSIIFVKMGHFRLILSNLRELKAYVLTDQISCSQGTLSKVAIIYPLQNLFVSLDPHLPLIQFVHTPHLPLIQRIPDRSFWKSGFRLVLVSVTCHSCQNQMARRPKCACPKTKCVTTVNNGVLTTGCLKKRPFLKNVKKTKQILSN